MDKNIESLKKMVFEKLGYLIMDLNIVISEKDKKMLIVLDDDYSKLRKVLEEYLGG